LEKSETMKIVFEFESKEKLNFREYIDYQIFMHHFKLAYILLRNNKEILNKISEIPPEYLEYYYRWAEYIYFEYIKYGRVKYPLLYAHRLYIQVMDKILKKPIIDYKYSEEIKEDKVISQFEGDEDCIRLLLDMGLKINFGSEKRKKDVTIRIDKEGNFTKEETEYFEKEKPEIEFKFNINNVDVNSKIKECIRRIIGLILYILHIFIK